MDLITSNIYRRTDLHTAFGGQRQGGISTPANTPLVMLFTGYSGPQHGYEDGWKSGVFCYFGEGQQGDMTWSRGNRAIRDQAKDGRDLFLFQMLKEPRSHVKYLGPFGAASWEYQIAPDTKNQMRQAIVFHLAPIATEIHMDSAISLSSSDLNQLREKALDAGSDAPECGIRNALVAYIARSAAVRAYALARAEGHCELCSKPAPFLTEQGVPFLEVHHIRRLGDGGPDKPEAVAALCPNCHREAHHGGQRKSIMDAITAAIQKRENRETVSLS